MTRVEELREVTAFEYLRRFTTASRPFEGYARADDGEQIRLCIKPVLMDRPESSLHMLTEVVGSVVATLLNVPVPEEFLVRIPKSFLAAAGSALTDVQPGWGFGSKWVERAFPAAGNLSEPGAIANPESVAGVTVLDTLLQNGDRHGTNVLLCPSVDDVDAFELVYIDNAHGFNAAAPNSDAALSLKVPTDPGLCELVTSQDMFMAYLVAAEGLPGSVAAAAVTRAKALGWAVPNGYASHVESHLAKASAQIRSLVMSGLPAFSRCR